MDENNLNQDLKIKRRPPFWLGLLIGFGVSLLVGIFLCVAAVFAFGGLLKKNPGIAGIAAGKNEVSGDIDDKLGEILWFIQNYGYYDYDDVDFESGVYKGAVAALDDNYAQYYTPAEYAKTMEDIEGTFFGIGATLQKNTDNGTVAVVKVFKDSPAQKAGVRDGDLIVSADDHDAVDYSLDDFVGFIRGAEGTPVHLEIYREGQPGYLGFDIVRGEVHTVSVEWKMLDDGIALITVDSFTDNTAGELREAYAELEAQGMKGIIYDLRSNGGGLLDSVVEILDDILPKGVTVYTETKDGKREDFTSEPSCMDYPIVVLTSGYTASAAEIFTGAIRDYGYGTILGTKTYGKGIVQTTIPLGDGSALKITSSKYFLPKGQCIHGEGIEPDEELEYKFLGGENDEYDVKFDNQIVRAVEILKGEM